MALVVIAGEPDGAAARRSRLFESGPSLGPGRSRDPPEAAPLPRVDSGTPAAYKIAVWRPGDLSFELEDDATSDPVVTAAIVTPDGLLRVMAEAEIDGTVLVLRGLHMHGEGPGPNAVGPGNLRVLADAVMERMGFDGIVVEGAVRTTGARPGHRPGRLRFARRVRPGAAG